MSNRYNILDNMRSNMTFIFTLLSLLFFTFSFQQTQQDSSANEATRVQKVVNMRLSLLEQFAQKVLETSPQEWAELNLLPDDMVIYKYHSDTIQSWYNQFAINNDATIRMVPWYRLHDHTTTNPLTYLNKEIQYVNLGNSWYIVKVLSSEKSKVFAGLLIKTEYLTDNSLLKSEISQSISLNSEYTVLPVNVDDSNIIFDKSGNPLFSIVSSHSSVSPGAHKIFRWLALLFAGLATFSYHFRKRRLSSLISTLSILMLLRILSAILANDDFARSDMFSPSLYADGGLFNSYGSIIVNHIFLFLTVLAIFMLRKEIVLKIRKTDKRWLHYLILTLMIMLPLFLMVYTHMTLRSMVLNSTINLELYNLNNISLYSIISYLTYALLFTALILSLQIVNLYFVNKKERTLLKFKGIAIYVFIISIYTISTVSYYGFSKEFEQNRVLTNKIAIDRDLDLELQLMTIEPLIESDQLLGLLLRIPNSGELIRNRLEEMYFWNITNKYDIRITVCRPMDKLKTETYSYPVDCFQFFQYDILEKYCIPLSDRSHFHFVNNHNSYVNYFGLFSFIVEGQYYNLYLEIDSKKVNEMMGYPSALTTSNSSYKEDIPTYYSYARYHENKLIAYNGKYNYPLVNERVFNERYSSRQFDGYVHFINKLSDDSFVIVSREKRSFFPYMVSFSYTYLFFIAFILGILQFRTNRRNINKEPRNSFKKKMTYTFTLTIVISIICMGTASIIFIIKIFEGNNRNQMEEKLTSIQTSLSQTYKYSQKASDIYDAEMADEMKKIAYNGQIDINIYDIGGSLVESTNPDIFKLYIASSRINPQAYHELMFDNKKLVIKKERIASLEYYSLYAPIFNINGKFIAILNIPYFLDTTNIKEDAWPIIAAIINLYLILIILAVFGARIMSGSIARPLVMISSKMKEMKLSHKAEHIDYKIKDELGILVTAYNNMVDNLEESTQRLAQNEREQAWREMARQIAHDIKNPLTPMRLSIQHLIRLKSQNIDGWDQKFDQVASSLLEQIDILSETATEFSSFSKFYNEDSILVNLYDLVREQYIFFNTRDDISFEYIAQTDQAMSLIKKNQISRVIVNLITNAIQAVEHKEKKVIRISLLEGENYFVISIEDNGPGVSEDNLQNLFKPNFTTKTSGTGLGLAICKNIIDQSDGTIAYSRSEEFGGANFHFTLPIYRGE